MLEKGLILITRRIRFNPFWGNFVIARRIIVQLDSLQPPTSGKDLTFYDLFYVFDKPTKAELIYHSRLYHLSSFMEEEKMKVKCEDDVYDSVQSFLMNTLFDKRHNYVIEDEEIYLLRQVEEQ